MFEQGSFKHERCVEPLDNNGHRNKQNVCNAAHFWDKRNHIVHFAASYHFSVRKKDISIVDCPNVSVIMFVDDIIVCQIIIIYLAIIIYKRVCEGWVDRIYLI